MKKTLTVLLASLLMTPFIYARDFNYNGVNYTVLDEEARTCETKSGRNENPGHQIEESVIIPSQVSDGEKEFTVTGIGDMSFRNCYNLQHIELPSTLTSIGSLAFGYWLTQIEIPASVAFIGDGAFYDCDNLITLTISPENKNYASVDNVFYDKHLTTLIWCPRGKTEVVIPNSVTTIHNSAFWNCRSLTQIDLPNSLEVVESYAFCRCLSLHNVYIPESVQAIDKTAFISCVNLTAIDVAAENTNYSSVNGVLYDKNKSILIRCPLTKTDVTIPNSVTEIGDFAFHDCTNLTSVELPDNLTAIGEYAFAYSYLTDIKLPSSLESIGTYAFFETRMSSIFIPASVNSIGIRAFSIYATEINIDPENKHYICEDGVLFDIDKTLLLFSLPTITQLNIPASVTTIADYACNYCPNLTELTIPNSVKTIGNYSFEQCRLAQSVTIPESVVEIGQDAFANCTGIKDVYYLTDNPIEAYTNCFNSNTYKEATLHISSEGRDKALKTVPWSLFEHFAEENGIEEITADHNGLDAASIYTLQGIRTNTPLHPGVYIIGGRKVLVK